MLSSIDFYKLLVLVIITIVLIEIIEFPTKSSQFSFSIKVLFHFLSPSYLSFFCFFPLSLLFSFHFGLQLSCIFTFCSSWWLVIFLCLFLLSWCRWLSFLLWVNDLSLWLLFFLFLKSFCKFLVSHHTFRNGFLSI